MVRTDRDRMHDKLDTILNQRDRNNPGFSVAWKATRIGGHPYAHANDVWSRLEPGDPSPRTLVDDLHLFEEREETPERRDRVEGRNRNYGVMKGGRIVSVAMDSLSVAMDSLEDLPLERISEKTDEKLGRIADTVRERLSGTFLNKIQRSYLNRLRTYLQEKSTIQDCSLLTITTLLRGLATQ